MSPRDSCQTLFLTENVNLEFGDSALDKIVDLAIEKKTGTRSLRSIIEASLMDLMFDLPSMEKNIEKIVVTSESVMKLESPRIYRFEKSKRQQRRIRNKGKKQNAA